MLLLVSVGCARSVEGVVRVRVEASTMAGDGGEVVEDEMPDDKKSYLKATHMRIQANSKAKYQIK